MPYDRFGEWVDIANQDPAAGGAARAALLVKERADFEMLRDVVALILAAEYSDDDIRKMRFRQPDWPVTEAVRVDALREKAGWVVECIGMEMLNGLLRDDVLTVDGLATFRTGENRWPAVLLASYPPYAYQAWKDDERVRAVRSVVVDFDNLGEPPAFPRRLGEMGAEQSAKVDGRRCVMGAGVGVAARWVTELPDKGVTFSKQLRSPSVLAIVELRAELQANGDYAVMAHLLPGQVAAGAVGLTFLGEWANTSEIKEPVPAWATDFAPVERVDRGGPLFIDEIDEWRSSGPRRVGGLTEAWATDEQNIKAQARWDFFASYPPEVLQTLMVAECEMVNAWTAQGQNWLRFARMDVEFQREGVVTKYLVRARPGDDEDPTTVVSRSGHTRISARFSAQMVAEVRAAVAGGLQGSD